MTNHYFQRSQRMMQHLTLFVAVSALQCQAIEHPYAFEKPLNGQTPVMLQKHFVQRTLDVKKDPKIVDTDSDEFATSRTTERERDRSSTLGEAEIRAKIFRNSSGTKKSLENFTVINSKKDLDVAESKTEEVTVPINATGDDLDSATSQTMPFPASLLAKKNNYFQRLKEIRKSELLRSKQKRKPISSYDEEYYEYEDEDEYYDDDLASHKSDELTSNKKLSHRKHFDANSKPSYLRPPNKESMNKQKELDWINTPPPLYSPATMPPMVRPARQGLPADAGYPSHRPTFSIHKKPAHPKTDRLSGIEAESSSNLEGVGSSYRLKVEEYDDDSEYYDDFEVVEKGKRRSDGYDEGGGGINPLALLIAPLVGISLLTAAVAVALNPVLVSVSLTGKRRKREIEERLDPSVQQRVHEMKVLERFLGTIPEDVHYQQTILSMYLSCSGYTDSGNKCLDRVVCEYSNPDSKISQEERDVISIVLYNIMANQLLGEDYKERLRSSARFGRDSRQCAAHFQCQQLDTITSTYSIGNSSNNNSSSKNNSSIHSIDNHLEENKN